jgi:hypothetical protein
MRSIKFVLSLIAVAASAAAFSATAGAAVPSPFADDQPDLVGDLGVDGATDGSGGLCPANDACWLDGPGTYQYFSNCIQGGTGYVYSYVGYWGKDDFSYPQTGDRYWGHIVSGVVGSACGGEAIGTDIELPAATQFDLDNTPEGKIRCFYTSGNTGHTEEITTNSNADCKQNPGPGMHGGYGLGGRIIPAFGTFEVIFPIRSTQPNLGTSNLTAAIDTALSAPKVAYPQAVVAVTAPPAGPNPNPNPNPGPGPTPDPDPSAEPDPSSDPDPTTDPDPCDPAEHATPRATPLTAKLTAGGKRLTVSGQVASDRSGDPLDATLYRSAKKGKPFRAIGTSSGLVEGAGSYALTFNRPKKGKCRATVAIDADPGSGYEAATTTVTGKC